MFASADSKTGIFTHRVCKRLANTVRNRAPSHRRRIILATKRIFFVKKRILLAKMRIILIG